MCIFYLNETIKSPGERRNSEYVTDSNEELLSWLTLLLRAPKNERLFYDRGPKCITTSPTQLTIQFGRTYNNSGKSGKTPLPRLTHPKAEEETHVHKNPKIMAVGRAFFSCGPKKLAGSKNGRCKRNVFVARNFFLLSPPSYCVMDHGQCLGFFLRTGRGGGNVTRLRRTLISGPRILHHGIAARVAKRAGFITSHHFPRDVRKAYEKRGKQTLPVWERGKEEEARSTPGNRGKPK